MAAHILELLSIRRSFHRAAPGHHTVAPLYASSCLVVTMVQRHEDEVKIGQTYKPSLSLLEQLSDLMLVFLMVRSSSWELVYHLFGRVPKVGP